MTPSIGHIVHYRLTEADADAINHRRHPLTVSPREPNCHIGNSVREGDAFPAVIVRIFDTSSDNVNLQVWLDGGDSHWATSRPQGDGPGAWKSPLE